jgi:16S rRNA processing protein RimM
MKLEYLEAGEIVTTHGVRGEMKIYPWSDGPEFLLDFDRVLIDRRVYTVESCRVQKTCNLLKLSGIDTVEDAQKLRGKTVEVFREDAPADLIFVPELIGMNVIADGVEIGKITDVLDYPGNKVYVIEGEHQYMVPAVKQFILSTDMENNTMQIHLIEGMRTDES